MTTLTLVPSDRKPIRGTQTFRSGNCPGLLMRPLAPYLAPGSSNDSSRGTPPQLPRI